MQAKLIIAAAIALLLAAMSGYILLLKTQKRAIVAENATLTQAYKIAAQVAIDNKATVDAQLAEAKRLDGILSKRESERAKAVKRSQLLSKALDDLKRGNQEARDWADVPVPDCVRQYITTGDSKDCDGEAVPPVSADAGNPAPGGSVPDKRRPADHD